MKPRRLVILLNARWPTRQFGQLRSADGRTSRGHRLGNALSDGAEPIRGLRHPCGMAGSRMRVEMSSRAAGKEVEITPNGR
jgi:hypothetical protein